MLLLRIAMTPIVLAGVAVSATFMFQFGWDRGVTEVHKIAYGTAGISLDLMKAALPLFAAAAFAERQWMRSGLCWITFMVFTGLSLWCAYGVTAGQLAERTSDRIVAVKAGESAHAQLARLKTARAELPGYKIGPMTEVAIVPYRGRVNMAAAQREIECSSKRGGRGDRCRDREGDERTAIAALGRAEADLATTARAKQLDTDIAKAEAAVAALDVKTAVKDADPQAAQFAKAFALDEALVATISHIILAVSIELFSGFGPWLVFGHSFAHRRTDPVEGTVLVIPADIETPRDARLRFFRECTTGAHRGRVNASMMYAAYVAWCEASGLAPMTIQAFGSGTPWGKERIGGSVYYINCALAEQARPTLRVIEGQAQRGPRRLGRMAKVVQSGAA